MANRKQTLVDQIRNQRLAAACRAVFKHMNSEQSEEIAEVIKRQTGLVVRFAPAMMQSGEDDIEGGYAGFVSALRLGTIEAKTLQANRRFLDYWFSHLVLLRAEGGQFDLFAGS